MARRKSRRRGRRNPSEALGRMGGMLGVSTETVWKAVWSVPGGILARWLPEAVLPAQNTGLMGYGLNLLAGVIASMAARRFISAQAADGILIGAIASTGGRIVSDNFGKELVTYADTLLGGDPAFNLGGYAPADFVLPTATNRLLPGTQAAAVMATNGAGPAFLA